MNRELSARVTLWVNRALIVLLVALPFLIPAMLRRWSMGPEDALALTTAFHCCLPVVLFALVTIDKLIRNILNREVFTFGNVRLIRRVQWCCVGVSVICLPSAFVYLPLMCMVVVMGFLALVVSVVKCVMATAVELREENDLTV